MSCPDCPRTFTGLLGWLKLAIHGLTDHCPC
jgi:hypothetical protein